MNLNDYQWSHNPRGMHNIEVYQSLDTSRYTDTHMGWAKIICGGAEFLGIVQTLMANNCTPIIRTWRGGYGATYPDPGMFDVWQAYIDVGVKWFEMYNEPNLDGEWPQIEGGFGPTIDVSYQNFYEVVRPMMDNWLNWAEWIIARGAYPGFIAFSETTDSRHAAIRWAEAFVSYLASAHRARFRNVIANGMWIATHPYIANHFYQAVPGQPGVPRPVNQQTANEGGWHFEYPRDPICQAHDPGRTVWGGTPLTPNGDPVGLTNMGVVVNDLLKRYVNGGPLPVVGTEGGIWRIPAPDDPPHVIDVRYPGYTWHSHAEATVAMFDWMANEGPPWMFGVTLWKEDDYFSSRGEHGLPPAVDRMKYRAPALKNVPALPTIGPDNLTAETGPYLGGPGPVHGAPDYHFVALAPGLQAEWFFETARAYWQAFRPAVVTNLSVIPYIPADYSLAVTVITRSDTISYMDQVVRDAWPNVLYDPIVADSIEGMAEILNWRAANGLPFGVRRDAPG
ncbi:MAG: hypothetical protein JXB47_03555 [Anaerolineae bacterium]|nr:hypothetical protein [Anaerolineae bacterium]